MTKPVPRQDLEQQDAITRHRHPSIEALNSEPSADYVERKLSTIRNSRKSLTRLDFLYARQRGICGYCQSRMWHLRKKRGGKFKGSLLRQDFVASTDHIVPRCKGGSDRIDNVIAACTGCNNRKGDMDATVWQSTLREAQPAS